MALLIRAWAFIRAFLSPAAVLDTETGRMYPKIAGGDGDNDNNEPEGADDDANDDDDDDDDPDAGKVEKGDDDATKARKHENWAKRERKAREKAEADLKELRDADKSDREKELEKAREEARNKALEEVGEERRADRLEAAVTRLAAKGVKVEDGDKTKTVKFADSEDALLRIERAIRAGDLDSDDIFDDQGKVKTDALTEELAQIASANPHLVADGAEGKKGGDSDARKGDSPKGLEGMTPEDHARRKYGDKK